MSLYRLQQVLLTRATEAVQSLQKQAPAAKIIGQFAVKYLVSEGTKIVRRVSDAQKPKDPPNTETTP
jgi:hypothetical protein